MTLLRGILPAAAVVACGGFALQQTRSVARRTAAYRRNRAWADEAKRAEYSRQSQ
jgi:hypothetical protein